MISCGRKLRKHLSSNSRTLRRRWFQDVVLSQRQCSSARRMRVVSNPVITSLEAVVHADEKHFLNICGLKPGKVISRSRSTLRRRWFHEFVLSLCHESRLADGEHGVGKKCECVYSLLPSFPWLSTCVPSRLFDAARGSLELCWTLF